MTSSRLSSSYLLILFVLLALAIPLTTRALEWPCFGIFRCLPKSLKPIPAPAQVPAPIVDNNAQKAGGSLVSDDFILMNREIKQISDDCARKQGSECDYEARQRFYEDSQNALKPPAPVEVGYLCREWHFNCPSILPADAAVAPIDRSGDSVKFVSEERTSEIYKWCAEKFGPNTKERSDCFLNTLQVEEGHNYDFPNWINNAAQWACRDLSEDEGARCLQQKTEEFKAGGTVEDATSPASASQDLDYLDRLQNPPVEPLTGSFMTPASGYEFYAAPECESWNIRCQFGWSGGKIPEDNTPVEQIPWGVNFRPEIDNWDEEVMGPRSAYGLPDRAIDGTADEPFQTASWSLFDPSTWGGGTSNVDDVPINWDESSNKPTREFSNAVPSPDSRSGQGMVASAFGAFFGFKK